VKFEPLADELRYFALQRGDIDVLGHTTWTMSRDTSFGLNLTAVSYYDGQGFLVRKRLGIASALELSQATICVAKGEMREVNARSFFRVKGMPVELLSFDSEADAVRAYQSERCAVLSAEASHLYALRLSLPDPDAHMVLPEIVSKEPLGPAVRQGDAQWFNIVKWALYAMIDAEELGIGSGNVDEQRSSTNGDVRRLLGLDGEIGGDIGLDRDWAHRIVRQIGNYGEAFERNLGQGSALKIPRGINALWTRGGILYAPPVR
jgi:general L-amino acid transport system substrate-binding protein